MDLYKRNYAVHVHNSQVADIPFMMLNINIPMGAMNIVPSPSREQVGTNPGLPLQFFNSNLEKKFLIVVEHKQNTLICIPENGISETITL